MTLSPRPDPNDIGGMLKMVHKLGSTTEALFSRLHGNLNRRQILETEKEQLQQQQELLTLTVDQIKRENEKLQNLISMRDREIERFQLALTNIQEGVIMQDLDGRIMMVNQAAQKLLGNKKNFWESDLGTLFDQYRQINQVSAELAPMGGAQQVEVNDKVLAVQLAAVADSDGNRFGTVIILRDITNDELSERLKSGFVTHISHELKTPMAVLRLASEVLLGQAEDQPPNRRMLEMLSRNIDLLDRMVIELLDVSEMSSGNFEIHRERLHLEPIIWQAVDSLASEIEGAKIDVTVMLRDVEHLVLEGDADRLKWALINLVRNSIVYNIPEGHIVVTAKLDISSDAPVIVLQVADTGAGISEKDMPHIFDLFYRGEARTKEGQRLDPRGLGQGLFVAQTIARAHGGYIEVNSVAGEGSTFNIYLPAIDEKTPILN